MVIVDASTGWEKSSWSELRVYHRISAKLSSATEFLLLLLQLLLPIASEIVIQRYVIIRTVSISSLATNCL